MNAPLKSSASLLNQLLVPLQGVVNFFSPPVPVIAKFSGTVIGAQPRLAKAPAWPSSAKLGNQRSNQPKIQAAGIRLVGQDLMGQMNQTQPSTSAEKILRSRRAQDGRTVISGRMRDVCAELDRLCEERV